VRSGRDRRWNTSTRTVRTSRRRDFEDVDRFRWVDGGSRDGYRDLVDFIDTVDDEGLADRLHVAIRGRGAFRRVADTLRRAREDELIRWFEFTGERQRGRARAWLADVGYRVARS
jgi:hypothetical protein